MFVRWIVRESSAPKSWRRDGMHLAAILVESVRVDGKPRQRHLAYLGSVRADQNIEAIPTRCLFWESVVSKLDQLNLSVDDRSRIEQALAERVPCPTGGQYEAFTRQRRAVLGDAYAPPSVLRWPRS